jgi:mannose-6-phosphate isomerase-like protein (cupin superfamily)
MTSSNPQPATPDPAAPPALSPPAFLGVYRQAKVVWVLGTRVRLLVNGADTGGRFSLQEMYTPEFVPGPPLHSHADADELFHILDGALKMTVGDQPCVARAGDSVIVPRGVMHAFGNPFLTPCRFLVQLTPAGFEQFFSDLGVPPASMTDLLTPPDAPAPTPQRLRELAILHHMHMPGVTD